MSELAHSNDETMQEIGRIPDYTIASSKIYPAISISPMGEEVIRIEKDGRIFWRKREVETDDEFRAAMMDLVKFLFPQAAPIKQAITDTTQDQRDEELARLREQFVAQQARIAQMWDGLLHYSDIRPDTLGRTVVLSDEGAIARNALATTDDLSALKAHDDVLWNEALTRGVEWQATRGHTLDADDYGNELRSLKR